MFIHVVKPGETIYSISEIYGVNPYKVIADNELIYPNDLVIGQTIVILPEDKIHVVMKGESLYSIASMYKVSVEDIIKYNPQISYPHYVYPGQNILIHYDNKNLGTISVNGYAYDYINLNTLEKTLPYLTYLSIFGYGFTPEGELIEASDEEMINLARQYRVAPMMMLTTIGEDGTFNSQRSSMLFNDLELQDILIENILNTMRAKKYYGLDIDFEYVPPEEREKYNAFLKKISTRLHEEGFILASDLAPKTSGEQKGLLYEGHDYFAHGQYSDYVTLMTYEWGYTYGPAMAVSPINKVREVLDYGVSQIAPPKILMGMPNYGYDWTLPYVKGESKAPSLSNVEAVDLARRVGAVIQYDEISEAPFFKYFDTDGKEHEVWFEDATSVDAKLKLIKEYGLGGASYWNIMKYFPQNWLVVNNLYNIKKVL